MVKKCQLNITLDGGAPNVYLYVCAAKALMLGNYTEAQFETMELKQRYQAILRTIEETNSQKPMLTPIDPSATVVHAAWRVFHAMLVLLRSIQAHAEHGFLPAQFTYGLDDLISFVKATYVLFTNRTLYPEMCEIVQAIAEVFSKTRLKLDERLTKLAERDRNVLPITQGTAAANEYLQRTVDIITGDEMSAQETADALSNYIRADTLVDLCRTPLSKNWTNENVKAQIKTMLIERVRFLTES